MSEERNGMRLAAGGDAALVSNSASAHLAVFAFDGRLIARIPPDNSKYEVVDHDG